MRLETERLVLRVPEPDDLDGYAQVFGDPKVMEFLGSKVKTRDETRAWIERKRWHWDRYGIGLFSVIRKSDERLLGRTGFLMWDPIRWISAMRADLDGALETEVGWTLGSEHWGHGYATEAAIACRDWALGDLGLNRLVSVIAPSNKPSIRVAEKIGETLERENLPGPFHRRVDLYSLGPRRRLHCRPQEAAALPALPSAPLTEPRDFTASAGSHLRGRPGPRAGGRARPRARPRS